MVPELWTRSGGHGAAVGAVDSERRTRSGGLGAADPERRSERWFRVVEAFWCWAASDSPYIPFGTVKTSKAVAKDAFTVTNNGNIHARLFPPKHLKTLRHFLT